jgi:hypothetical protein
MITNYDIDRMLYRLFKAAVTLHTIPINGDAYNGDRPLNSDMEDITVKTLSVSGDGFPQNALTNINCYVKDIAEDGGGYVRDGRRLDDLSRDIVDFIDTIEIPNTTLEVEAATEIAETAIHQHYLNVRVRTIIYAEIN